MRDYHRKSFFLIFAVFFVIISPVLIFYSLGYGFDVDSQQIENSLSIQIEPIPRRSKIVSGNAEISVFFGGELKAKDNTQTSLTVRANNYFGRRLYIPIFQG